MPNKVKLPTMQCLRCGHHWYPKKEEVPINCGFCKSPRWNTAPKVESVTRARHDRECEPCKSLAS